MRVVPSVERDRSDLRRRNDLDDVCERERQGPLRKSELGVVVVGVKNCLEALGKFIGESSLFLDGNGIGEGDRPAFLHIVRYSLNLENCTEDSSVSREI